MSIPKNCNNMVALDSPAIASAITADTIPIALQGGMARDRWPTR